jgi:CCR4-NOT transcription complex subunit 9
MQEQLVLDLTNPATKETALLELSKKRESFPELAPYLWHSFGTMAALLQEIVSIYPMLQPPSLTAHASNRVCNALALLQCVASHTETRSLFLQGMPTCFELNCYCVVRVVCISSLTIYWHAHVTSPIHHALPCLSAAHIPLFLYPFLNTVSKTRPFEYLRLTSLGVIGALVKVDDSEVINFLLSTEIIPLCLRTMETGSELSKTVATFIVQKILLDSAGLAYICATAERFFAVGAVLSSMVTGLAEQPSVRLLKHIVRCYLRLSDNPRAREALRQCLPDPLRSPHFTACLRDDLTTRRWLAQLLINVGHVQDAAALGTDVVAPTQPVSS